MRNRVLAVILIATLAAAPAYAAGDESPVPEPTPAQCEKPLTKPFQFSLRTLMAVHLAAALAWGGIMWGVPKTPLAEQIRQENFGRETLRNGYASWDLKESGQLTDTQLARLMAPNPGLDHDLMAGGFEHPERVVMKDIDPQTTRLDKLLEANLFTQRWDAKWQESFARFLAAIPQPVRDEMIRNNIRRVILIYPDHDSRPMVLRNEDPQTLVVVLSGSDMSKTVLKSKGPVIMHVYPIDSVSEQWVCAGELSGPGHLLAPRIYWPRAVWYDGKTALISRTYNSWLDKDYTWKRYRVAEPEQAQEPTPPSK